MMAEAHPSDVAAQSALILIVEDELLVARDIEKTLTGFGYRVLGRASTADEAIRKARARRPDLVLMDIRLPGTRDGVDAAAIIHDELDIPVIFLSAFSDGATLGRVTATEPFGYIVKPFNQVELRCAIEVGLRKWQTETAVRARERFVSTTLRSIGDGVVATNEKETVTFLNRVAEQLTGWTEQEARGRTICEVMRLEDDETGEVVEPPLRAAISTRRIASPRREIRLVGKRGAVPIDNSAAPIIDETERLLGGVTVFRDATTARRRVDDEVRRQSEATYRLLFENAADGLWLLSIDGTILDVNRRAQEIYGAAREDMIGQHFSKYLSSGDTSIGLRRFSQLLQTGSIEAGSISFVRPDGSQRTVSVNASIVDLAARRVVVGIARDITESQRLSEQVSWYQRMESIAELTQGVAHDFNNILAAILIYSDLLAGSLGDGDTRRHDVDEIKKAGERGAALSRQLLAFSRRDPLAPVPLDLNNVISSLMDMLVKVIGEDIDVTFVPDPRLDTVIADTGQIEQVITNLVVNARDAMPGGGSIRIETRNIDEVERSGEGCVSHGRCVAFAVSDSGCGMDAATKRRVFEPFFTTKGPNKGTGLGLSTCHKIVAQSGGHIALESELGRGTTFTVYLPRVEYRPAAGAHQTAMPASLSTANETVLVIEDDAAIRALTRRILEKQGYKMLVANDGDAALAMLESCGAVHLVLSDIGLPGTSGDSLLRQLRRQLPDAKLLLMSGYMNPPLLQDWAADGVEFIQKPFAAETLGGAVRALLDRRTPDSGA